MPREGNDEGHPAPRKGNRAHKLRRRRKIEDNPMSGGALRRIYPVLVRRARQQSAAPPERDGQT